MNSCLILFENKLWINQSNQASLRFNAIKLMLLISKKYPELINDIKLLCNKELIDSLSPGVLHSVKKNA
jgi:hypothetical protein